MRATFINTLTEMARQDDKIMCIIGDTGFSVFEDFEKEFGSRFVNVGIAEQNFVSFGAGLAAMGMKPYIYNVVSFMTLRAMEQILLDVCYQENPVVLVGVGGGFAYATAGPTHHAVQDITMLTSIPNMTVVCPGDPVEMKAVMLASLSYHRPLYIRIGRSVDPVVHQTPIDFKIGKAIQMKEGTEAAIFVTGVMLQTAVEVQEMLEKDGISVSLYSMPTVKPIDEEVILQQALAGKTIFTIEEHSVIGGLGDAAARVLVENQCSFRLKKFGVRDEFVPITGTREYLDDFFGLSSGKIVEAIKTEIGKI